MSSVKIALTEGEKHIFEEKDAVIKCLNLDNQSAAIFTYLKMGVLKQQQLLNISYLCWVWGDSNVHDFTPTCKKTHREIVSNRQ